MTRTDLVLLIAAALTGLICTGIIAFNFIYAHRSLSYIADLIAKTHGGIK